MKELESKIFNHLAFIYGEIDAGPLAEAIGDKVLQFQAAYPDLAKLSPSDRVSERDSILITYGDMLHAEGERPLQTLTKFLTKHLKDIISTVHILPFYPFSSDDGFSVIDYRQVNPNLGNWEDVGKLGSNFRLMFDAVVNHVSAQSVWFQGFLDGDPAYRDYFTVVSPEDDLTGVFRPRATPVVTAFQTVHGEKLVWTTFSADQVDINFSNPAVLLEVIDILLFYAAKGADFIRLDAVTYIWKEIGTTCINMPKGHRIIQLLRTILDQTAPKIAIITETNVPHKDNIAYFGDGFNEAQMVYNFALPLLTLHAFQQGDVQILSEWAATLDLPTDQTTFFNFTACHDGIGLMPVKDILSTDALNEIVTRTRALGGFVSYKSNEDGSESPYELNINYLDALVDPEKPELADDILGKKFLATQAIMLALRGVPGIYFHSIFGSRNWSEGVGITGRYRTINREKLNVAELEDMLSDPRSLRYKVFFGYCRLLKTRMNNKAFHPNGGQRILSLHRAVFAILRTSPDGTRVLCMQNTRESAVEFVLDLKQQGIRTPLDTVDLIGERQIDCKDDALEINLDGYEILWLGL